LKYLYVFVPLLIILCATISASVQSTDATISGVVVDSTGRVIPDAEIEIMNDATGVHYSSATNGAGIYTITILPPGQYRVQVSKIGFKTLIKPDIILNVQSAVAINFTLPIGATSESVTVEAGASTINTSDGSVSTVIDRNFVENMPLNGRSFQSLMTLVPGVAQVAPPDTLGVGNNVGVNGEIVVNGQRTESNYFSVDGVSANTGANTQFGGGAGAAGAVASETALGTTQSLVSIDALQEFRATTSTYSAEYGRTPGGQFSFTTRSGSKAWHGSAYDYLRNDAMDANNWFNDFYDYPKEKERQNDFGGTLGGSVYLPHVYDGREPTVRDSGKQRLEAACLNHGFNLKDVSFSYGPKAALSNLTFQIGAGERIAIIGASGSGKSTMARLLVRVADPESGCILLEDHPLTDYTLASIRGTVCYVPQHPVLFQGSVRENLMYANPRASVEQMHRAIEAVQLASVLSQLPQGLDTPLGPGEVGLSGGERQRLAVARSLLRESAALVLDEATSALDAPTERTVLQSLAQFRAKQTIIVISHRIRSLTWVDRFVLLDQGKIVATGIHSALYAQSALYRSLFDASAQGVNAP
jgi:ABC-type multidrug transport system fused ATPase/permease subunit